MPSKTTSMRSTIMAKQKWMEVEQIKRRRELMRLIPTLTLGMVLSMTDEVVMTLLRDVRRNPALLRQLRFKQPTGKEGLL